MMATALFDTAFVGDSPQEALDFITSILLHNGKWNVTHALRVTLHE
jgi:hypothetical protein